MAVCCQALYLSPEVPHKTYSAMYTDPGRLAAAESARIRRKLLTGAAPRRALSLERIGAKVGRCPGMCFFPAAAGWGRRCRLELSNNSKEDFYAKTNGFIDRAACGRGRVGLQQRKVAGCRG